MKAINPKKEKRMRKYYHNVLYVQLHTVEDIIINNHYFKIKQITFS